MVEVKLNGSWWHGDTGDTVSGARSGMSDLTNQNRLGGLKGTGAKTVFQTDNTAALNNMRELMCFLSIKACKPILVVTKNKIMNQNEHICIL